MSVGILLNVIINDVRKERYSLQGDTDGTVDIVTVEQHSVDCLPGKH